jgi:hypothetical protein
MPIYVTFYHLDKTMVGRTEGEITLADLTGYLEDRLADLQALVPPADTRPVRIFNDIHAARAWLADPD